MGVYGLVLFQAGPVFLFSTIISTIVPMEMKMAILIILTDKIT
jgi:hypothetical protein